MNKMTNTMGLRVHRLSSFGSRFETLEMATGHDTSLQGQLRGKLRKVFPLPAADSTAESIKRLLEELDAKQE